MNKLTPNLIVNDVNKTIEFYKNVLGFEVAVTVPESGQFDWAMIKCGGVELMFQSKASAAKELPEFGKQPIGGSLLLYIDVADVASLCTKVKAKAKIKKDLYDTFYGTKEFAMYDQDGYLLVFAQGGAA